MSYRTSLMQPPPLLRVVCGVLTTLCNSSPTEYPPSHKCNSRVNTHTYSNWQAVYPFLCKCSFQRRPRGCANSSERSEMPYCTH